MARRRAISSATWTSSISIGSGTRICCFPPGTHHITVTREGKTIWSGDVTVVANKKVIVYLDKNGTQKTVDWKRGDKAEGCRRDSRRASRARTVAVAPVTGSFSSAPANINCGQSSTLTWQSGETVDANISGIGTVR